MAPGLVASDGLIARPLTSWTREKLFYIDRYIDAFTTSMYRHWTLVYSDLLAGPGLCVDTEGPEELSGSPLLAAKRRQFERLYFNDVDPEVTNALSLRLPSDARARTSISTMDCFDAVVPAREFLFPPESRRRILGLSVIDPTAYQMSYEALKQLTDGVRTDLIIIYMTGFARRFINTDPFEEPLTRFLGTEEWKQFIGEDGSVRSKVTFRTLLDLYRERLGALGYAYVNDEVMITNSRERTIYHMVFASEHEFGERLFRNVTRVRFTGQRRLL